MICNLQCELPYPFRYIYTRNITHTHTPMRLGIYRARGIFSWVFKLFTIGGQTNGRMDGWAVRVACWLRARRMAACGMNHSIWPGLRCCCYLLLLLLMSPMLLQLFALHLYKYILCLRRSLDVVDVVVCRTGCEDASRQETETQVATGDWEADVEDWADTVDPMKAMRTQT